MCYDMSIGGEIDGKLNQLMCVKKWDVLDWKCNGSLVQGT